MKSVNGVDLTVGMTVYVSPANSTEDGPIEARVIAELQENKITYDKEDQYGYIGAKLSCVYSSQAAAEKKIFLFPGIYGTEFNYVKGPFDLKCGQMRANQFTHNSGWYNKFGQKLGFGDLSAKDIKTISKEIPEDELFYVLSETDSFWNFVTKISIIGSLSTTDPKEQEPGIEYVEEHFIYLITRNKIYCRGNKFERDGIVFEKYNENCSKV